MTMHVRGMKRVALVLAGLGAVGLGLDMALRGGPAGLLRDIGDLRDGIGEPHQSMFAIRNFTKPWLHDVVAGVRSTALTAEARRFGEGDHLDDGGDAFRHVYAAALMTVQAMRDHGMDARSAGELVVDAGDAHELDGMANPQELSAEMDRRNNRLGVIIVGDGTDGASHWLTDEQLEQRVVDAMRNGQAVHIDGSVGHRVLVPTSSSDVGN